MITGAAGAQEPYRLGAIFSAAAPAEGAAAEALAARARRRVHETIGLTAEITVVSPHAIERSVGKARRGQDLRQQGGSHA